jgi:hypothetical protein
MSAETFEEMERIRQQRGLPELPPPKFDDPLDLTSLRFLNESALREHALACSDKFRAGLFTRVGQDFVDEVKADVEKLVRELRGKCPTFHDPLNPQRADFVTGLLADKILFEWNAMIGRLIQNKVQRQPSCGKTLRRTR